MAEPRDRTPKAPRIDVEVTAEIIRDSRSRDSSHCMIAEALRAAYPDATKVAVDIQTIRFTDPKKGFRYVYLTPRSAQSALIRFDQEVLPEPFRIRLQAGQVTASGRKPITRSASEKQKAVLEAARAAQKAKLSKAQLIHRDATHDADGVPYGHTVPERIGGKTPPVSIGLRREFGIRAFDRIR